MMTFYKAPHKAMLSYATIRSSEERRNMHRELEHTRQMLQACVCGIAVTLDWRHNPGGMHGGHGGVTR